MGTTAGNGLICAPIIQINCLCILPTESLGHPRAGLSAARTPLRMPIRPSLHRSPAGPEQECDESDISEGRIPLLLTTTSSYRVRLYSMYVPVGTHLIFVE